MVVVQLGNKCDWSNTLVLRTLTAAAFVLFTVHTITASHKSWGCESEAALDWSNVTCMLKEHDWSNVIGHAVGI